MNKIFYLIFVLSFTLNSFALDAKKEIENFYQNVYSLKTKGVNDFVVDIKNSNLRNKLNEQKVFGDIDEIYFRLYWTSSPERIALEVMGLEGDFNEVKDILKTALMPYVEELVPLNFESKFKDYDVKSGNDGKSFELKDRTGINSVPSFIFKLDEQKVISHIQGKKPAGEINYNLLYEKKSFSLDKLVLVKSTVESKDSGVTSYIEKNFTYSTTDGIGVLKRLEVLSRTMIPGQKNAEVKSEESFDFKNYKINRGEALNYFLGEKSKK